MSVQVPDRMVFEYVHSGLTIAANNTVCNDLFASCISQHVKDKLWDEECIRLIRSWAKLNNESFSAKYNEGGPAEKIRGTELVKVSAIQLYKYVQCIQYNIELYTIEKVRPVTEQEHADCRLLKTWKLEICSAIVSSTKKYKDAAWSEYRAVTQD